ncbi:THO complex subunit Tho1 [Penicillium chermesinum]|uniref:THO complex subunit Tho1 n=1 Tax=Penicillium chermesinum TaxID=63820 RepID=A0A9W9NSZ1_9EURO|nr:THO complex subunit Tho1 [Penicillium chermesinum]KAJ5225206.1 THO complex subunit Tho1 [Penicillium chermesinum]
MAQEELEVVSVYKTLIESLLDRAAQAKPDKQIEPPLTEAHLGEAIWQVSKEHEGTVSQLSQQTQFAAAEIAFREKFYHILASTSINDPSFIDMWNLLDIVSIVSDNEQCEPGLIFWLIEELLDSQTIDGCRKVFDYLESRRERNIRKHFKQKNLIILRSCNELLRRLSRAEDTVFCGRVFIFLFQSFPLGDKSSVNLRGEFHTENVTTFDDIPKPAPSNEEDTTMAEGNEEPPATGKREEESPKTGDQGSRPQTPKVVVSNDSKKAAPAEKVDLGELYPLFWGLQAYFSNPTKTFDSEQFASFKAAIEATLNAFKNINTDNRTVSRQTEEERNSHKRKHVSDEAEIGTSFNPKYLTSRDLFDLEVSDEAFRRHVLVQALILFDFLLSLNPKAKARLTDLTNRSVLYGFTLNEEDTKWVTAMRKRIEGYLQEGVSGKFYYRMVDTVLSRDKNWVRWKAEGCPPIERPAVSVPDSMQARKEASKLYANKRLRPTPMGALDLSFLSESAAQANFERLKEQDRYTIPAAKTYMGKILDSEMDIDMASNQDEKDEAVRSKTSQTWRILRLSAKTKLAAFDKIEDGNKLEVLLEAPAAAVESPGEAEDTEDAKDIPQGVEEAPNGPLDNEVLPDAAKKESTAANEESTTTDQGPLNSTANTGEEITSPEAAT